MATSSDRLHTATRARHAPPARPLVLVADDDEEIRFLFRTVLEIRGYRVIEAADGEEAVRLAQSAEPDLILMDGYLPRVDGLDATRRIRRLAHVGRVPIVFVSGRAEPAFRAEARDAGCDDYVVKPCGLDELGGVLEKHLGRGARASTA
jgi:CheY-like chemotaxis protein